MSRALVEVMVGGAIVGALWCWLQYFAWGGVRYQRRAAWLRPALARRVLREARRKQRALDREIHRFLRRTASLAPGRADRVRRADTVPGRTQPESPDTLGRSSGPTGSSDSSRPTQRKPGPPA